MDLRAFLSITVLSLLSCWQSYCSDKQYTFDRSGILVEEVPSSPFIKQINAAKSRQKRQSQGNDATLRCYSPTKGDGVRNIRHVTIERGQVIEGLSSVWDYKSEVTIFRGVPYAAPPTGANRFKPPQDQFQKKWLANCFSPVCPQDQSFSKLPYLQVNVTTMNEDCLYLDIYTPNMTRWTTSIRSYPVMVFIPDGEFMYGTSRMYPGLVLARQDVIVVSINYRLNAFGFLSTGDSESPGNYGLLDIRKALAFVRRNIKYFGGQEENITVVGHGAGAAALGILLVSPVTRGEVRYLFKQAILMGGSDTSEWAVIAPEWQPQYYAYILARELGCPAPEWDGYAKWNIDYRAYHKRLMECIRFEKTWQEIVAVAAKMKKRFGSPSGPFAPVVDGYLLPRMPAEIRRYEPFAVAKLPLMAGVCRDAGSYHVRNLNLRIIDGTVSEADHKRVLRNEFVAKRNIRNNEIVGDALEFMYTFWPDPENATARLQQLIDVYSDTLYGMGPDDAAKGNIFNGTTMLTYFYVFGYRSVSEKLPFWMGTPHGKDIEYILGFPMFNATEFKDTRIQPPMYGSWQNMDVKMSKFMMTLFYRFAAYGNATIKLFGEEFYPRNFTWQPFNLLNRTYGNLDEWSKNYTRYRQLYYGFWRDYWWRLKDQFPVTTQLPSTPASFVAFKASTYVLVLASVILIMLIIFSCYFIYRKDLKYKEEEKLGLEDDLDTRTLQTPAQRSYAAMYVEHTGYASSTATGV